jgi:hypothetical protein
MGDHKWRGTMTGDECGALVKGDKVVMLDNHDREREYKNGQEYVVAKTEESRNNVIIHVNGKKLCAVVGRLGMPTAPGSGASSNNNRSVDGHSIF